MNAKVTVALFVAMLFGIALFNLLSPDRLMSETENRYLQQMPKFSWNTLQSGKFTADFNDYITDQFIGRDVWVGLKTVSDMTVGKKSSKGVYFAKDNYLMETFDTIDMDSYNRNLDYVRRFSENIEPEFGISVQTMLVPSSSGVLWEKRPSFAPDLNQQELLDHAASILPSTIDIMPVLESHRNEYIYYRTDHHWTTLGAFYAYHAWREQNGLTPRSLEDFEREIISEAFYGTTYSKARLYTIKPDSMEAWQPKEQGAVSVEYNSGQFRSDSIYECSFLDGKDKYSAYLNGNQPVSVINTQAGNGKRLLLIKDSYANAFVQLLTADYEEIVVVDLRFYREPASEIIRREEITDVLILYSLKGFAADVNLMFLVQ